MNMANDTVVQDIKLTVRNSEEVSSQPESDLNRVTTTPSIPESTTRNLETSHQLESTISWNATSETIPEHSEENLGTTSQNESEPNITSIELSDRALETTCQIKSPETTETIQELLARSLQTTSQPESPTQPLHQQANSGIITSQPTASNSQSIRQSTWNSATTSLTESASSPTLEANALPSVLGPIPPIENKKHLVGPKPTVAVCHVCGNKVRTLVYHSATLKTHLTALCLCICGCACCACVPYCLKSSHNVDHYCSYCSSYLGTYYMK